MDEMEKADIAKPKIAVMLHNGIVQPIFKGLGNGYVPCVIPQSYDFVEIGNGKFTIKVKNEEKPWAMPNTKEAKKVHELLTSIGANSKPDEDFEYTLLRNVALHADNGSIEWCDVDNAEKCMSKSKTFEREDDLSVTTTTTTIEGKDGSDM